jgi:hypothetical protein
MRGCQCLKSLWLHKHRPAFREEIDSAQAAVFARGTNVGLLARDLYPNGIDASPVDSFHYQQSVVDTQRYLAEGKKIIYEAAFQYEGVLAAIDILVQRQGKWYAYEVKSSTSVKDPYIMDTALQYHVITGTGLQLQDIFVVHINSDYVRQGDLSLRDLFTKASILRQVKELQPFIRSKAKELKRVVGLQEMPHIATGDHCYKPYSCDFLGFCEEGAIDLDMPAGERQVNQTELREFLSTLAYPLYFMDFETYQAAVPEYDGHWAYRRLPFQFSVHRQDIPDGPLHHECFLAEGSGDTCSSFIQALVRVMGHKGSVIVYNKGFENSILNELKDDHPCFVEMIEGIQERIVDLMVPFRRKHLYLPEMQGSYSIKYVLPALVPEMSYGALEIGNGGDASAAFSNLRYEEDVEVVVKTRAALLAYCELDTLAMVKILEKLNDYI